MKRFLLVQHHFFPLDSRGFRHLTRYAGYLNDYGWEPVVLTKPRALPLGDLDRKWGLAAEGELATKPTRLVEVHVAEDSTRESWPLRAHKRLAELSEHARPTVLRPLVRVGKKPFSAFSPLYWNFPDTFCAWVESAVAEGARILERERIDAILSHCPIESNHLVASRLAARFGKPWFAYFGDLYGYGGDGEGGGGLGARWLNTVGYRLRRRWLSRAARCFAVSPAMAMYIERHYGVACDVIVVGYDECAFPPFAPAARAEKFRIAHTGSIYPEAQPVGTFFDGVARFRKARPDARLDILFVGSKHEEFLRGEARARGVAAVCRFEPTVPTAEAIRLQRASDVLVAFNLTPQPAEGTLSYPSKTFEYLASGRRIIVMPPDHDWVDRLLAQTGAGTSVRDAAAVASLLEKMYGEWEREGELRSTTRMEEVRKFSSQQQAAKVAAVMNGAVITSGETAR